MKTATMNQLADAVEEMEEQTQILKAEIQEAEPKAETKTAKIVHLHNEGKAIGEIAKSLNIRYQHVYNTLKGKGIEPNKARSANNGEGVSATIEAAFKENPKATTSQITKQVSEKLGREVRYQHVYNVLRQKGLIQAKQ